ncbi:MAG: VOC family protein [Bryobacteraceae bacterium]
MAPTARTPRTGNGPTHLCTEFDPPSSQVDDILETYGRLMRRGVRFTTTPAQTLSGYGAELADPDGHRVRLWDAVSMKANAD